MQTFLAIFRGTRGVRTGWRFLGYAALIFAIGQVFRLGMRNASMGAGWTAESMILSESVTFVIGLIATLVIARLERRGLEAYGFPWRGPWKTIGARFVTGALWGFGGAALLMLLMAAAGGYHVRGLAIHGGELVSRTVLWGLAFVAVGLSEELVFRAYPLNVLARGMGFWPAAIVLSLGFGALHYFGKPMETWLDGVNVTGAALLLCLMLRRTGDLWLAIGWHFAFDDAQIFVFGGPNTGNLGHPVPGHLLDATFSGPQWLTGGPMGPEASVMMTVMLVVSFVLFSRRHPTAQYFPA